MTARSGKTLMGRTFSPSAQVEQIIEAQAPPSPAEAGGAAGAGAYEQVTQAVLFTDIVGSTAYFEQRGDQAGLAMVERHNGLLFPMVEAHGGTIIKTIGDAIMARFDTAAGATAAAVAMQLRLREHNAQAAEDERIRVRIGINFGPVLKHEDDLFGDVVNAAARVEALAGAGQILLSGGARQALDGDFELPCSLYDAVRVKGKQEPIEVYLVAWNPEAEKCEPAQLTFEPGRVLGDRYEILSRLGEGGMGQVYEVRDRALDEICALKFVHPDLAAHPDSLQRFKDEIKMARSITHPNICRIHEFLEMDGRVFLSMERIRGKTLETWITDQGALDEAAIIRIADGICAGLEAAHEKGITHRDLKPANVMIEDATDRVVLMDFGIAQLGGSGSPSEDGFVVGTPEYMSPEQVRGGAVGPLSDIYALGIILYEMATARPPHVGDTPMVVAVKHIREEPEPVERISPNLPPRIGAAIRRCLDKEPRKRFARAGLVAAAIRGAPPVRAGRRASWFLAIASAAIVAALAALWLWPTDLGPAGAAWKTKVLVSNRAMDQSVRFSRDGRQLAFVRDGEIWLKEGKDKPRRLSSGAQASAQEGLNGLSWQPDGQAVAFTTSAESGYQTKLAAVDSGQIALLLDRAGGADLSPDGQRIAFVEEDPHGNFGIAMAERDGSGRRTLLAGDAQTAYLQPRFSPDGRRLALVVHQTGYESTRDIAVFDTQAGQLQHLTQDGIEQKVYNTDPTWTADGAWIVYVSKRGGSMSLWQVSSAGGTSLPLAAGALNNRRQPDVDEAGKRIVFATKLEQLDISTYQLESGEGRSLTTDVWRDRFPAFSPDGKQLAFRAERSEDDLQASSLVRLSLEDGSEVESPAPAGMRDFDWCGPSTIVFAATRQEGRLLGLLDLVSGEQRILLKGFYRLWSPHCDQDGTRVAFSAQQVRSDQRSLWIASTSPQAEAPRRLVLEPGHYTYPAFSPDGRHLAFRWAPSEEHLGQAELRLVTTDGSDRVSKVTDHRSFCFARRRIRFTPDGKSLLYIEAHGKGGRLWMVARSKGTPKAIGRLDEIHTFDFDLSPDGHTVIYARAIQSGDIYLLQQKTED